MDRRAEYLDLPVTREPAKEADTLIADNRNIFASSYRFTAPAVPPELIAAAEEISPHLVLLKRIWPLLLPHYDAPITLFRRWASWIAERNRERPWRAPHHGDAADLIDFVARELMLLGIAGGPLRDLVRYEALKLAAAALPAEVAGGATSSTNRIDRTSTLGQARPYLIAAFATDIGSVVAALPPAANDVALPQWVVFTRQSGGTLGTLVISEAARRVLERAREPCPAGELVRAALLDRVEAESEPFNDALETVRALVACNLLKEVRAP
jgi:hypothetical protein